MANEQIIFYCPLIVCCDEDGCAEPVKLSNRYLVRNEDRIREALRDELQEGENMADYLDPPLSNKVFSMEWDIAAIGRTAYGKITCELLEPLTREEQEELAEWILGQNSDGLGEGFEQHPVDTDDGELYVSFWHSGNDYFVLPEDDFQAQVLEQSLGSQGFGGMEGMC